MRALARDLALVLMFLVALMHAPAALAHASLIRSEPADRAVLARAPASLTLTFNEPVSPLSLRLIGEGGHTLELADVAAVDAALTVRLPGALPEGTHLLSWRVVSADGHPVGGSLTFSVGRPSAGAPMPEPQSDPARAFALWTAKLVLYLGLFAGIGGAFYARWIAGGDLSKGAERLIGGAMECALVAVIVSVGLQGVDAFGQSLSSLKEPSAWANGFATSYGRTAAIAALALVIGLVALRAKSGRWLSALALAGAGAALAASGHASAAEPQWLTRPAVFLHGVTVAFWIGALMPLADALRAGRTGELARFSRAVLLPLALLIACGVVLALVQVRRLDALWTTDYGLVLLAKLAAVAVLLVIALGNRWRTARVIAGEGPAMRRIVTSIKLELVIVAVILGLVAGWRFTPPPRSLLAAADQPVHTHIHTEKAMADLKIGVPKDGGRTIEVVLLNGAFGPLAAKEVTLFLSKPDAGIERLRLPAVHVEDTIWRVEGAQIPALGRWHVSVEILISDFEKTTIEDEVELPR
jgi:copper transport protein